jgi:mRNA interferase MazF
MKRGEVRWYTFKEPDKRRPVLILTRSSAIGYLNTITVAPITTTIRDIPTEVYLSREYGLLTDCAVNFDNIQTVAKSKIGDLITCLSSVRLDEANTAIGFALGLDELIY